MRPVRFGLGLQSDKSADEYAHLAVLAESHGFDVISVYSDFGFQPPIVPLTIMAQATNEILLGPACLNPYSVAPFEMAGQLAALDIVSQGRAYLGVARGTWLAGVGLEQKRAVTTIRESLEVIRRLLSRDTSGYHGDIFHLEPGIGLSYDPWRSAPPILIGTWGPNTAALAGEVADEVKVGGSANSAVVPWIRQHIARGAEREGRDPDDVQICLGAVTVVDEDGAAARALARREVAMYLAVVAELDPTFDVPSDMIRGVRERTAAGDYVAAGELVSDEVLDRFAFSGTPEDVSAQAQAILEAGADRIEFGTPHGLTHERGVRLLGDRVIPQLR